MNNETTTTTLPLATIRAAARQLRNSLRAHKFDILSDDVLEQIAKDVIEAGVAASNVTLLNFDDEEAGNAKPSVPLVKRLKELADQPLGEMMALRLRERRRDDDVAKDRAWWLLTAIYGNDHEQEVIIGETYTESQACALVRELLLNMPFILMREVMPAVGFEISRRKDR